MGGKTGDAQEKRNAANAARKEGTSPSAAGATTGASKQIDTQGEENRGSGKS